MKNTLLFTLITFSFLIVKGQNGNDTLRLDLDKDLKKDIVIFDKENAVIVVKLSSQQFKPVKCKQIEFDPISAGIRVKREGFEYFNNWMRAGYACQFRYNPTQKQVQLIGMSRYEFGPANNDGSGKSSINLLTNSYIGEWNYWDLEKNELITIPAIKQTMILPKVYFASFGDEIIGKYEGLCSDLYEKSKAKIINKKATRIH